MPLKSKEERNAYQRLLMRRRRSAAKVAELLDEGKEVEAAEEAKRFEAEEKRRDFKMQEAEDLRLIVEDAIKELRAEKELDPVIKARAIFQGAQVAIKLLELTDLAKRVKELEAAAKDKQEGSWKDSQF
jgi:hypothetical protein